MANSDFLEEIYDEITMIIFGFKIDQNFLMPTA